jgi:hypothetical protein
MPLIGVTRFCGHSILDTTWYPEVCYKLFVSEALKIKLNKIIFSKVVSVTYKISFTYEQKYKLLQVPENVSEGNAST